MKTLIFTTIMLLGSSVAVAGPFGGYGGQGGNHDERMQHRLEKRLERMSTHLNLTDAQKMQVKSIMQEQMNKRKTVMQQLRTETQTRISTVLTPEQQQRMREMRAKREQRRLEHQNENNG